MERIILTQMGNGPPIERRQSISRVPKKLSQIHNLEHCLSVSAISSVCRLRDRLYGVVNRTKARQAFAGLRIVAWAATSFSDPVARMIAQIRANCTTTWISASICVRSGQIGLIP